MSRLTFEDLERDDADGHNWTPKLFAPGDPPEATCGYCEQKLVMSPNYVDPTDNYVKRKVISGPTGPCPKKPAAVA